MISPIMIYFKNISKVNTEIFFVPSWYFHQWILLTPSITNNDCLYGKGALSFWTTELGQTFVVRLVIMCLTRIDKLSLIISDRYFYRAYSFVSCLSLKRRSIYRWVVCSGEGRTGRISAQGLDIYGPSAARSVQKRPRTDILPVRSLASLVNKRFIDTTEESKDTSAESFGTMPGPILREYWTGNRAFWLVDFSYWPSDCLSRVIKQG